MSRTRSGVRTLALILAVVALVTLLAGGAGASVTVLIGDQAVEASNDSNTAGTAEAFRTSAAASGALTTLSVYVASASTNLVAGLYASNSAGTHPTTLLAQGTLNAPVAGTWNAVTLTSQPQLVSGTTYWMTILSPVKSGTIGFRDASGGGSSETSAQTTLSALPSTWTTGTSYKDGPISAYGSSTISPDTTPPAPPTMLAQTGSTATTVSFGWAASTDNIGVAGYGIYVNGTLSTSTTATSASVGGLACGSSTVIAVDAFDAAGNRSTKASASMPTAACPADTSPPSVPTNLVVSGTTQASVTLSWSPSTDDVGVAGYQTFLDGNANGSTTNTSITFSGLTCGTSHALGVSAFDAAGNASGTATATAATAACADSTPPTVAITAPAANATVSGTVTVSAATGDNVGVAGVQFRLDGANLGTEATAAPYTIAWNTTAASNGPHTLTAVARDAAGNTTTSATVSVTVANPSGPATPTPIPAANVNGIDVGPGFVVNSNRQVVRTAAGTVYIVAADDDTCQNGSGGGVIRVFKGSGAQPANSAVPTSFTEMDAAHHPVSGGSRGCQYTTGGQSALFEPDSRLDGSGTIQMVYIDQYNRSLYYQTFSTVTNTWGPRTVIATSADSDSGFSWPRGGQVALTLDANDVPHVLFATNGSSNQIDTVDKVSGAWSRPAALFSGTKEMYPSMTTAPDGSIDAVWLDNALGTSPAIKFARWTNGSWSSAETVSAGDSSVLGDGDADQGASVATDSQGTPYVSYLDGAVNGTNDYVRVRYRTSAVVWTDDSPPSKAGGAPSASGTLFAHSPQIYISSTEAVYVFLGHDNLISPGGFEQQTGGHGQPWSAYVPVDPRNENNTTAGGVGIDGSASVRYDPLRDNNPSLVDELYYDENDGTPGYPRHAELFYKAIQLR